MMKKSKGFTLIELMVVVVILGILAVVVAPRIPDLVKKAKEGATKGSLSTLRSTLNIYYSDTEGVYPATHWSTTGVTPTAEGQPLSSPPDVLSIALVPKYIKAIPAAKVPTAHAQDSTTVYYFYTIPKSTSTAESNSGFGWAYGSVYGTNDYGQVVVNCSHTDTGGNNWVGY